MRNTALLLCAFSSALLLTPLPLNYACTYKSSNHQNRHKVHCSSPVVLVAESAVVLAGSQQRLWFDWFGNLVDCQLGDSGNLPGVAGKAAASALDFASARILWQVSQTSQTFEWGDCDARFKHIVRRQSKRGLKSMLNLCFSAKAFVISLFVSWRSHRSSYFSTYFCHSTNLAKSWNLLSLCWFIQKTDKGQIAMAIKREKIRVIDLGLACNRG